MQVPLPLVQRGAVLRLLLEVLHRLQRPLHYLGLLVLQQPGRTVLGCGLHCLTDCRRGRQAVAAHVGVFRPLEVPMVVVSLVGRVALVVILLCSGAGKLTPAGFAAATGMFRSLLGPGRRLALPAVLAAVLATAELAVAGLLAVPATASLGAVAAVGLFAGLTGGVAVVLGRRLQVRCACFGTRVTRLRPVHLVRNGAMLAAAAGTCVITVSDAGSPGTPHELVLAAMLGAFLALILMRLDDLAAALSPSPARP